MKVYFSYSNDKFLNSYVVANEKTGEAIFVDPLKIDLQTINLIESHNYRLRYVLFTHGDKNLQREGALTISKIYRDVEIVCCRYSGYAEILSHHIAGENHITISGDGEIELAGLSVEYFSVAGLTLGAYCYKIDNVVFCGDALVAGRIGETSSDYATQNLQKFLQKKIFSLEEKVLLFPMHGAPSSIGVELLYNDGLKTNFKERRRSF